MQLTPLKSLFPSPTRGFPSPASLAFTPTKIQGEFQTPEKVDAEKAAAESAVKAATAEIKNCEVSTSSCGKEPANTCWNCDKEMTFDHQCDIVHPVGSKPSPPLPCWKCDKVFNVDGEGYIPEHHCAEPLPVQPSKGVRPEPSPPRILKKPVRMLDGTPVGTLKVHRPK